MPGRVLPVSAMIACSRSRFARRFRQMTGIRPRADTVVVLATPWWRCAGRALLRGCRMPHALPEGCESFWDRSIDGLISGRSHEDDRGDSVLWLEEIRKLVPRR